MEVHQVRYFLALCEMLNFQPCGRNLQYVGGFQAVYVTR
jgi:hypothetical protein